MLKFKFLARKFLYSNFILKPLFQSTQHPEHCMKQYPDFMLSSQIRPEFVFFCAITVVLLTIPKFSLETKAMPRKSETLNLYVYDTIEQIMVPVTICGPLNNYLQISLEFGLNKSGCISKNNTIQTTMQVIPRFLHYLF